MSQTNPNAFLMEAAELEAQAKTMLSKARELKKLAKKLMKEA